MAGSNKTWVNNQAPTCDADDLNSFNLEPNNAIADSGQTLDYSDRTQLSKALWNYWNTNRNYIAGAIVRKTGTYELYGSLINNNQGNALPNQTSDTNWKFLGIFDRPVLLSSQYLGNAGYPIFNKENALYPSSADITWGTAGKKHLWLFDNNASGIVVDEFGTYNLTENGSTLKQSRDYKNGSDVFNYFDDALSMYSDNVDNTETGSFSCGMVIDFNSIDFTGAIKYLVSKQNTGAASTYSWGVYLTTTNGLQFDVYYNNSGGGVSLIVDGMNKLSGIHFIEFFCNISTNKIQMYIDGVLVGEKYSASLTVRNNADSATFLVSGVYNGSIFTLKTKQKTDIVYFANAIPTEAQHQALVSKILGYTYNSGSDTINEMGKDYTRILTDADLDVVANYALGHRAWGWIMDSSTQDAVGNNYTGTLIKNTGNTGVALKVRNAVMKQSRHLDGTLKYNFFNGSQILDISNAESADIISATQKSFIMAINLKDFANTASDEIIASIGNFNAGANYGFSLLKSSSADVLSFNVYYDNVTNSKSVYSTKTKIMKGKDFWIFIGQSLEEQSIFMKIGNELVNINQVAVLKDRNCSTSQRLVLGGNANALTPTFTNYLTQSQIKQAVLIYRPFRLVDIEPICDFLMAGKISHSYGAIENYGNFSAIVTDKDGNKTQSIIEDSVLIKTENNAIYYNMNEVIEQSQKVAIEVK